MSHRDRSPEERAFSNFLRYGINALNEDDKEIITRNRTTLAGASGGEFIVPTGFKDRLREAMAWWGAQLGPMSQAEPQPTEEELRALDASLPWIRVPVLGHPIPRCSRRGQLNLELKRSIKP